MNIVKAAGKVYSGLIAWMSKDSSSPDVGEEAR
jgi:hypothetical protein